MADTYRYPAALSWDQGPESLKKLKNKLLLYFSSKDKSNGGECEIRDTDCSRGHILIHFKEETVRNRVLQKQSHEMKLPGGQTMRLKVRQLGAEGAESCPQSPSVTLTNSTLEDSRARDRLQHPAAAEAPNQPTLARLWDPSPSSFRVLIEKVQDGCTTEMLNLLVENVSGKNENSDFYVERIRETQSAAVTFTCDVDILSFIQNFAKNPRVRNLTAKPLEESRTIRVEGLPPGASEDYVSLYFEKPNHGGSGSVEATKAIPEEEAALVTFSNVQTAKKVLGMKHEMSNKQLSVYPYYHSHDMVLYGKQIPHIEKPQPLKFSESPYILEFILNDPDLKDNMERRMRDHKCEIKWPDVSCPKPVLTLCFPDALSTHLRTMAKLAPKWKKTVSDQLSQFIANYTEREYNMNQGAWETIKEHIRDSTYSRVLIKPDFSAGRVFLAGRSKDVTELDPLFQKLVEETTKKCERTLHSVTETMSIPPGFYQIICNSGLLIKILAKFPDLKMDYNKLTKELQLHGLKEEVVTAQCDILTLTCQLKSKCIHMNSFLIEFVMSTDNDELSYLFFLRRNINALLEIDNNTLKLTAYSDKDLTEAEEQIRQELIIRQILVEEKNLLKSSEWRRLHSHLMNSLNVENPTVLMQECPPGADSDLVIAGLSPSVHKCHQQVSDFLEKNTPMEKNIRVKSPAVMQFLKEENEKLWNDLKKNMMVSMHKKNINIRGGKQYVTKAAFDIEGVLSSLFSDTLSIDKPGAKKFWLADEAMYVTTAKNQYNCIICLPKEEDQAEEMDETQCQVKLPNGVLISAYKGDLCCLNVDVIVNAANEDLNHCGGLALALSKAAGPKLQEDCNQIVKKKGQLFPGNAVITNAAKLPCKQVIHAVGPSWNSHSPSQCEQLLQNAISSSLMLAEEARHTSIAIPAISSGIYGFPVDKCAENIVRSIKRYLESNRGGVSTIKNIHLVDTSENTSKILASVLKREFGQEESDLSRVHRMGRADTGRTAPKQEDLDVRLFGQQMTTKENIVIRIREGLIQEAATDVVVNSVGQDLDLDSGGASMVLLERAGRKLQQCLYDASSGARVEGGSAFITVGCNLPCQFVIHVVVPEWDKGKGASEKVFREIVLTCLKKTEEKKMESITFPAIGTGILGFPKSIVAASMFEEVIKFSSKKKAKHLKEVNFILHPNDRDTIAEFSRELTKLTRNAAGSSHHSQASPGVGASAGTGASPGARTGAVFFGAVKTPTPGVHEMTMGSLLYQVKAGDITKENTDVIVNSTDQTFTMKSGVSKAILDAAGKSVQDECAKLGSQGKKPYIVTKNGNLPCKKILHVVGRSSVAGLKDFVAEVLTECARLQASSVAFPAIGTGMGSISSDLAADTILEAVADFANSPKSVRTVKVVVFQQRMLDDFCTSMKKKEGTALLQEAQSLQAKITRTAKSVGISGVFRRSLEGLGKSEIFELGENIEPAIFHLCAPSQGALSKATSWLRELMLRDQHEIVITNDWIQEFSDQDQDTLIQLQKKHEVSLRFDLSNFTIKVSGLSNDVLDVSNKIQTMTMRVQEKKTQEREAELCSRVVEWSYDNGSSFVPFGRMTNMELEKAWTEARGSLTISLNDVVYTVILELEIAKDPRGNKMKLQRILKNEQLGVPEGWDPMRNSNVLEVPLSSGTQEYKDVEAKFQNTCQRKIIKITRIQNRHLWMNYQIKKQSIDGKNGSANSEKQLFHGCDSNSIKSINQYGFNRSYAGKNMAYYGNGTYFAVAAQYSADNTYSKPDANGNKHMYLSRVVTGLSGIGKGGMRTPPPKNPANPADLYDSVTNDTANPIMYVIFNDIQAYPEYLITFN